MPSSKQSASERRSLKIQSQASQGRLIMQTNEKRIVYECEIMACWNNMDEGSHTCKWISHDGLDPANIKARSDQICHP